MLQTKYITLDEFRLYFNLDLEKLLGSKEEALAFMVRVEDRLEAYLLSNFARNVDDYYPLFTGHQKDHYKKALLEQCIYIIKNSDISVDSGIDPDRGVVIPRDMIEKVAISINAENHLRACGLWNRSIPRWR